MIGTQAAGGYFRRAWLKAYRRLLWPAPTSITREADEAWQQEQFRYYATQQPFAGPLTIVRGNLTGETWEMRKGYREWAIREPAAKAALLTKCFAVAQLDPQVEPADPDDANDKRAAEWLDYSVRTSKGGWSGLIYNILFPGLVDGFSVLEKLFGHVDERSNHYAGFWTLTGTASIDTELVRFKLDTYRRITGLQAVNGVQNAYVLPPEDYIIYTHLKLFENPFGFSDLRAAVRACRLIEDAIRLRHILMTNYSGPFLKAQAGDPAARARLMDIMNDVRASGWVVVPEGTEIEVIDLATANLETFRAAVEDYRQEIVQAIQGAYLQLLEGGQNAERGNTQVHAGIAELFVWWLAVTVCEVINDQLTPDLIRPNFGNRVGFPRVTLGGIDESMVTAAMQRFQAGQQLGLALSKRQVRKVGGFEVPADEADTLAPPQAAQHQDPLAGLLGGPPSSNGAPPSSNGAAEGWHRGTSPASGESGWVSSGGGFRRNDPSQMNEGGSAQVGGRFPGDTGNPYGLLAGLGG